jgi:diguanylate cyclase (GGDEF)-like protein
MKAIRTFDPGLEPISDLLLFEGAEVGTVTAALARSQVLAAKPGEVVITANSPNVTVYVLLRGTLRVDVTSGEGGTTHIARGECVGELSVIDGTLTSATVTAVDECELLALQGPLVLELADFSHAVARNLLRLLSRRLRGTNVMLREEAEQSDRLRLRATTDALTGLFSRGWLDHMIERLASRAEKGGESFAVVIMDVDHFKAFNDRWGQVVGDRVLQRVADALRAGLRPTDLAARYGGEEFIAILNGLDRLENAVKIAQRVHAAVGRISLAAEVGSGAAPVTASLGVAVRAKGEDPKVLVGRADEALHRAKQAGGNRVEH